jgi:hypothetical protein
MSAIAEKVYYVQFKLNIPVKHTSHWTTKIWDFHRDSAEYSVLGYCVG